ncbi:beta-ketoacyl-ACP synthase III [Candidatus Xianfuyuplasma coldseepsis]|uniref:Beta-ketoacyl-[acyl-carrier-protein] synthase III n=1 Tax=Candidatus Xianfuyuplasma coldseepsis TaxID=2782163 RepID=A0A7L7KS55_9MOLU|nr:beta-ketoacyl-ACP synthase III [Xianfuyuplasma coldseepsis]QMS85435.1 ketoacyl-ACP synthase III [Xianfuyuplasma coldseepsis]
MIYTKIKGTGSYVPKRFLTNDDLAQIVDTNDEWIRTRTGIEKRHIVTDEYTIDLAEQAALEALESSHVAKEDIDLVIVATVTPDHYFPGIAQLLQKRLGLKTVTAFDINAACSGFLYALQIADKMIKSGAFHNALIVGAETLTRLTDWSDRNTCVLFGDAAGAMVIGTSDYDSIRTVITGSDGDDNSYLICDNVDLKDPYTNEKSTQDHIHMNGREVFKFATRIMPQMVRDLLEMNKMSIDDLDYIVAHQANLRIIDKAARDLNFSMDKMYVNINEYGNTSAASVPLAIDEAIRKGHLKRGDQFVTVAFGGGFTWGGALITY